MISEFETGPPWRTKFGNLPVLEVVLFAWIVPTVLVWLHHNGREDFANEPTPPKMTLNAADFQNIGLFSTLFCLPGTVVLSTVLCRILRVGKTRPTIREGATWGAMLAFTNLPAWLTPVFLFGPPLAIFIRTVVLIAFTGACCGAWLSWRACGAPIRFSLMEFWWGSLGVAIVGLLFTPGGPWN